VKGSLDFNRILLCIHIFDDVFTNLRLVPEFPEGDAVEVGEYLYSQFIFMNGLNATFIVNPLVTHGIEQENMWVSPLFLYRL